MLWASGSVGDPNRIMPGAVFDADGNIYLTSFIGGLNGCGTVFKLTHISDGTWTEKNLVDFDCGPTRSVSVQRCDLQQGRQSLWHHHRRR